MSDITPYDAWSKEKPNVEHMHVFGCLGYMKIPSAQVKKLGERSKPVIFLGREAGTKAYRLYDQ